jgi:hypothetical protein
MIGLKIPSFFTLFLRFFALEGQISVFFSLKWQSRRLTKKAKGQRESPH